MKSFPGMREYFGVTEMPHLDCMYKFTKNYRIVLLTGVHFMICKLYHNKSCFKNKFPGDFDVHLIWGNPSCKMPFLFPEPCLPFLYEYVYPSLGRVIIKSRTQ